MNKTPIYRWKVSHPAYGSVEVTGPRKYELSLIHISEPTRPY